jgi:hypothetical protein
VLVAGGLLLLFDLSEVSKLNRLARLCTFTPEFTFESVVALLDIMGIGIFNWIVFGWIGFLFFLFFIVLLLVLL